MPLTTKKEPHEYAKPLKNLEPNEEVFVIRFTQEYFRKYEDYLQAIEKYRERTWTCEVTGKTFLTFEEALLCEKRAMKKAHNLFPTPYIPQLVNLIHQSSLSLDALVDKFIQLYNQGFVMYEQLNAKIGDSKIIPVQIVNLQPPSYQCKILQYEGNLKDYPSGSTSTFDATQLTKQSIPKSIIKGKIRAIAIKSYTNGPWIISDQKIATEFNLVTDIPEDVLKAQQEHQHASESESSDSENDKPKKKKARPSPHKPDDSHMADELLEHSPNDIIPLGSADFLIPQKYLSDTFACWSFANNFSNVLRITPFSLEDFQDALSANETSQVFDQLMDSLLKTIGKKSSHSKSWEDNVKSYLSREITQTPIDINNNNNDNNNNSTHDNNNEDSDSDGNDSDHSHSQRDIDNPPPDEIPTMPLLEGEIIDRLKEQGFHKLEVGDKIAIIKYMCDEAMETDRIRIEIDKRVERSIELDKEKRTTDQDHKRKIKQLQHEGQSITSAITSYKKATDEFENEKNRNRTRLIPLGQDRHYNQYWYFANRLFVEEHASKTWHYYATKVELEQLFKSLDERGTREAGLKNALTKRFEKMVSDINKRHLQLLQQEPNMTRRSERRKAAAVTTERLEETALHDMISDDDYLDYDDDD